MDTKSVRILLVLLIAVAAFVAWELAGLDPHTTFDTISWHAQRNVPLAVGIEALFLAGGIGGAIWWPRHLRSRIAK